MIRTVYRDAYLADLKANPCNASAASPLACAPAHALRRWLLKNDCCAPMRPPCRCSWCGGGDGHPVVSFANTKAAGAYFAARGAAVTGLDLEETSLAAPYLSSRLQFAAAKEALRFANKSVKDSYWMSAWSRRFACARRGRFSILPQTDSLSFERN